jgi:hypothetical protein
MNLKLELNLGFYQARQVFELGYDFSPVCDQFVGGTENYWKKYLKLNSSLAVYCEPCIELIEERGLRKFIKMENIGKYTIPIIPKAALEACLPRNLDHHPYSSHLVRKVEKLGYRRNGEKYPYINFDSAYEAFIWVHENYPEELKAKFKEII